MLLFFVECNGCSCSYLKDSIVLYIQSDIVEVIYNIFLDLNLILNFGDILKDMVVKFVVSIVFENKYIIKMICEDLFY